MDDYQKEMEANYPVFKAHIFAQLREEFERTLEPIDDLEAAIIKEGGLPLEAFIHQIRKPKS